MSCTVRSLPPFADFAHDVLGLDTATRRAQIVIQKALDGSPFDGGELDLFRLHTGRETPRASGYPYGLVLVGRQGGKTEQAAARLVYEATAAVLGGQRDVACVGISQDHRAAQRVLFGYVQRCFERPLLRGLVRSQTQDAIVLDAGVRVLVLPCRPASIRGLRCRCVVLDEVAHFRSSENLPLDREAWRASLPTLLTTNGKLLALTSPYVASGLAHDLHRQHYGRDSDVLVWQSPSYVLHPGLSTSALSQLREADPEGAAAEIEGEFLTTVAALLDEDALSAAVDEGVAVRKPVAGRQYAAFVDVATGTKATGDRWACGIAHVEDGVSVLDALLVVAPPFSPQTAAEQTAALCKEYGVSEVSGDKFAAGFSDEAFGRAGLRYVPALASKSELYIRFAAAVQSGTVRLLDLPEVLKEARGLERRRGATQDRVDHRRGGRDDAINAAAGALVSAASVATRGPWGLLFSGDGGDETADLIERLITEAMTTGGGNGVADEGVVAQGVRRD
jgi:hypothetical protein